MGNNKNLIFLNITWRWQRSISLDRSGSFNENLTGILQRLRMLVPLLNIMLSLPSTVAPRVGAEGGGRRRSSPSPWTGCPQIPGGHSGRHTPGRVPANLELDTVNQWYHVWYWTHMILYFKYYDNVDFETSYFLNKWVGLPCLIKKNILQKF